MKKNTGKCATVLNTELQSIQETKTKTKQIYFNGFKFVYYGLQVPFGIQELSVLKHGRPIYVSLIVLDLSKDLSHVTVFK